MWELCPSRGNFCSWKVFRVAVLIYRAQVNNLFFWRLWSLMGWMQHHGAIFPLSAIPHCSTRCQHWCHVCTCLSPCSALASCSLQCQVCPRCWHAFLSSARQQFKIGLCWLSKLFRNDITTGGQSGLLICICTAPCTAGSWSLIRSPRYQSNANNKK